MQPQNATTQDMFIDLSFLGLVSVKGPDVLKLLQGQLTCDMTEISPTQSRLAAHCNPSGRIITLFRVLWFQDQYLLQMPKALIPIAINALKKYAIFFKVTLQDVSDHYKQIGYRGKELRNILPDLPQNIDEVIAYNSLIINVSRTEPRYIILSSQDVMTALWEQVSLCAKNISGEEWRQLDIKAEIPAIYPETSEKFLPHDLNLPKLKGVNFQKGCYTGQEIIARMEYRGKPKNHLFRVTAESPKIPVRGADIFSESNSFGSIVDYSQLGYNTYELLVIGPIIQPGTILSLDREQTIILNIL